MSGSSARAPGKLCQWFTPSWVCEALVEQRFSSLSSSDTVIEPSCGPGQFLRAIPAAVRAIGVELDPALAALARAETGREVIVGDFLAAEIPASPTVIIGNPPFVSPLMDGFIDRAWQLLPEGGRAGFLLPCYFLQAADRVLRFSERWRVAVELLPRNAFHTRMRTPLVFALLTKAKQGRLFGLALYPEAAALAAMPEPFRRLFGRQRGSAWREVCELALTRLGGAGKLDDIYADIGTRRPTANRFWRDKVRQTLRAYPQTFEALGIGRFGLRERPGAQIPLALAA